jgi:hypothetical protein
VAKTQQSEEPGWRRTRRSTAHWCTFSAALDETGWPWLRLRGELVARRLTYRTCPEAVEIDWGDPNLKVDRAESTVTIVELLPPETEVVGFSYTTVAVEVLLPVGQRPPAALIKASWRDRVPEKALEVAMKEIAQSYAGKPRPLFKDVWSELKGRFGDDLPRAVALDALANYAPQLKRAPGQTKKIKSPS